MLPRVVLASTSPYRAERLATLDLPFEQARPDMDETPLPGETPFDLALRLARGKALSLTGSHPNCLIIGSDQTAADGQGNLLGKPGSVARAVDQLSRCSGNSLTFYSGVALAGPIEDAWVVTTEVIFRDLTRAEIDRYIEKESPLDCAGSFKVEALGITLFQSVRSDDPNALIGLPLISLANKLREAGYFLP
ncbi:Maf family protein [Saccharospirillum impatiens]|uniref:Maf family protein n=1 Tax=Saccharospirillum impatiens TaxID=169438 RepID=UPI00041948A2|nr:Maf family nucleotide pyrophosphatase [Saccharospirillum impatiens]